MQVFIKNEFPNKADELSRGDVFVRKQNNKVYMFPEQSGINPHNRPSAGYGIINLESGDIFTIAKDEHVRIIRAKVVEY